MLDANTIIPPMVADIIALEPRFPDIEADSENTTFPLGILTPIDNGSGVILSGEERYTPLQFQIDVYDTDHQRCEDTANMIAKRLVKRGFVRLPGQTPKEKGLQRHCLTFKANVDEHTGLIYRR